MRVFVGNQTSCWAGTATEPFDYAVAQGFNAFEWFPDKKTGAGWDESDLDARARRALRETARANRMRLSVHARWQANPLSPESNDLFSKDLELARELGSVLFNIHLFHESGISAFVKAIEPLVLKTAEAGLQLSIENTPHHSPEQFNELFDRLRSQSSSETGHVGMCLDVGHANLAESTRNDYLEFCNRLGPHVPTIHLHLHENWGDSDSHLPLFTGPSARDDSGIRGLLAWLKKRNFSGSMILEQWPHPASLLNNARDRLLTLWEPSLNQPTQDLCGAVGVYERKAPNISSAGFTAELTAGDRQRRSWREKLELVSEFLTGEQPSLNQDQIVDIAIYLRFLATGQIACTEDGRHFRPAHHARIAAQIYDRISAVRTPSNEFLLRKIYPWLPSSAPDFQRPEPLTRIRDIAHRNDISSDLKREIKTRLQNKLHRCAGPEDLVTSSEMLERVDAPGAGYPPDFVQQFRIFHEELKEFFNAQSLEERLKTLLPFAGVQREAMIGLFLKQKGVGGLPAQLAAFKTLTELRQALEPRAEHKSGAMVQELTLADIALEDFAFVLLSQVINSCETVDSELAVQSRVDVLNLALENLALSQVNRVESNAIQSELQAWGPLSSSANRSELLRFRASLLRCRRLADDFGEQIVELFSARAENLGRALGVAEHAIQVFSESDIRSHLVFQVSKLADGLLRRIREWLKLSSWDVIVPGRAVGRVRALASLEDWDRTSLEPAVLLVNSAAGDEEIPKGVVAIALAHEIAHLSHLAVRARQSGVVFVTCDEASELKRLRGSAGQVISFTALPDNISWERRMGHISPAFRPLHMAVKMPDVQICGNRPLIRIENALAETSGAKAAGMRRLAEISSQHGSGFLTPDALVVPFGVMEAALAKLPAVRVEYLDSSNRIDALEPAALAQACRRLGELVERLEVPEFITKGIQERFGKDARLAVRSSANCEDLKEFAGAGLYQSIINVATTDLESAIRAVWCSLWTQRAAESRRAGGIPHDKAHMAVLIQESLTPDFSFVLHTVNPITREAKELYAEIAVGLGEVLASASAAGSPYRITIDKQSSAVEILAFANFSQALRPDPAGGVRHETVDYSKISLSKEAAAVEKMGRQLSAIGAFVERALGGPQDIEGAVVNDRIYLVQARPQQGLDNSD